MSFCKHHPDVESSGKCANCKTPLCYEDKIVYSHRVSGGISMLGGQSNRRFESFDRELYPICYATALSQDNAGLRFKLIILSLVAMYLVYYTVPRDYFSLLGLGGFVIAITWLPMIFKFRTIQKAKKRSAQLRVASSV